jgi:2-polyprenyl-6-methoxyphenol hydroxylase-like FAD-dependent oxidoreductase
VWDDCTRCPADPRDPGDGWPGGKPASPFSLHFDAQEVGAERLGHIAENRHIRAALYEAVRPAPIWS